MRVGLNEMREVLGTPADWTRAQPNTPSQTCTRTHTHTATTTTYETFSDVMLGQPCATDSIDLSVNFSQPLRVVRAWMGRRSERRTSEGRGRRRVRAGGSH